MGWDVHVFFSERCTERGRGDVLGNGLCLPKIGCLAGVVLDTWGGWELVTKSFMDVLELGLWPVLVLWLFSVRRLSFHGILNI